MSESIDLAALLSTAEGIRTLQNGSNVFGIRVFAIASKTNNCVDYGVTTLEDWVSEVTAPRGYEALQDSTTMTMDQIVSITHENHDPVPVVISDFRVLPRDTVGRPQFKLVEAGYDGEDETPAIGKVIRAGHSIQLRLRCSIKHGFEGFLGRWIIISFTKTQKISSTCLNRLEFKMCLRVGGEQRSCCNYFLVVKL